MAQNVKVAVRVRPFNDREKALNAVCCVDMQGPTTLLKDIENGKEDKVFSFDYSFWSHDGFKSDDTGMSVKDSALSRYADQQYVYNELGKMVLDNAWEGFHCCLFAYGQTGSGKSYSMVGYGRNRGIVPIACEEIFNRSSKATTPTDTFEVSISMLEIYNEMIQDLLIAPAKRSKSGLEVHESKQLGVYIDGLSKRSVASYAEIESVVEEGTNNRTIGSTLMNATSSRAHTVISIEFRQMKLQPDGKLNVAKMSVINLVDLAGSEKAGQTGASGDRLKEGCAINKSLSALGNVIAALADKASGKLGPSQVIPYRDSKLTRLLQSALGGNSRTIMICAVSPASSNYEETLSTLRYADRAKKIKNAAIVNENPVEKLMNDLKAENERLKAMMMGHEGSGFTGGSEELEKVRLEAEQAKKEMEARLAESQKSWEQKLKEAAEVAKKVVTVDLSLPHIANLNEDPQLTGKLFYPFPDGSTWIGKANAANPPQITLAGIGVFENHASATAGYGAVNLRAEKPTYVNGKLFSDGQEVRLAHGDRLIFGQNYLFVFVDPAIGTAAQLLESNQVSHAAAKKELAEQQGELAMKSEAEIEADRKRQAIYDAKLKEAEESRLKLEAQARAKEEDYERKLASMRDTEDANKKAALAKMEAEMNQLKAEREELERKQKKLQEEEAERKRKDTEAEQLDEQLMAVLPLCKEASLIAKELGKPYAFKTKLNVRAIDSKRRKTEVAIQVEFEGKVVYEWSRDTLENRIFLMRELFESFCEDKTVVDTLIDEQDPFWDPVQTDKLIGTARILLESLTMQLENEVDAKIMSAEGRPVGTVHIEIWPLSKSGSTTFPDDELAVDANDLMGTKLWFKLRVKEARGLPEKMCTDVRMEYNFYLDETPYRVGPCPGENINPVFNYEKVHVIESVTSRLLQYLTEEAITFNVYAISSEALHASGVRVRQSMARLSLRMNQGESPLKSPELLQSHPEPEHAAVPDVTAPVAPATSAPATSAPATSAAPQSPVYADMLLPPAPVDTRRATEETAVKSNACCVVM